MTSGPVRLIIAESPVHGRGVFTKDPIAAGSLLERCPMMYLEPGDTPEGGTLMDYVFDGGEGSWLALGLTSLVNHAEEPNAEVETDEEQQVIRLRAIRDIAAGEELFIHYGESYFVDRGYDQTDLDDESDDAAIDDEIDDGHDGGDAAESDDVTSTRPEIAAARRLGTPAVTSRPISGDQPARAGRRLF